MSPDELERLERLQSEATALPWSEWMDMAGGPVIRSAHTDGDPICWDSSMLEENAAYIVAACNAVPALIARIRELEGASRTIRKELREQIKRLDSALERLEETRREIRRA